MNFHTEESPSSKAWNLDTKKHPSFPIHGDSVVTCLILDVPYDVIVTASDDHTITVYTLSTGQLKFNLIGHQGGVWCLSSVKHDGQNLLASGSSDKTVRIWDLASGKCLHIFRGHTSTVRCLVVVYPTLIESSMNDKDLYPKLPLIVTASRDKSVKVWSIPGKDEHNFVADEGADASDNPHHLFNLTGHTQPVRGLSAHGRTAVSGSYDHTVRVWDIISGECRHVLIGHSKKGKLQFHDHPVFLAQLTLLVYAVVYDPIRDQVYSTGMDGTIIIWSAKSGVCLHTLTGHQSLIGLLELSSSNLSPYLISGCADATLKVWDPITGTLVHTLSGHPGAITCFYHDEKRVLAGGDGLLRMWDIQTGTVIKDLLKGMTAVWQVAFDGQWGVCASSDVKSIEGRQIQQSMLHIWDFGESDSKW
ncbi:cell division control protein 4 [Lentinula aciculospora]|uniref:Cell division control protein 4 n=1 Tax=Lentinula aciculospora TaxID=153920 RepID=A0A9W9DNT1_9AGAR|nr:cell division control protein 4 [Lentinula aciculospora]